MDEYYDCLNMYSDSMHRSLEMVTTYLNQNELMGLHGRTKNESVEVFLRKPKLSSCRIISSLKRRMENVIEEKLLGIIRENELKLRNTNVSTIPIFLIEFLYF